MKAALIIILGIASLGSFLDFPNSQHQMLAAKPLNVLKKVEEMSSKPTRLLQSLRYRRA